MTDVKLSAETPYTAPLGNFRKYTIDSTPTSGSIYAGDDNLLPDGYMLNGKISVTVTSNNITLALKTRSGGNPSTTDPVSVWINGSFRRCTAALSVTKNAGTNWFNSGSSGAASPGLATNEIDYFAYLIWNTTPATDILDIGFSRIPFGNVYSDFSGTTTNEKYLAFANASTPTSTDDVINIGRFAATLSATASFNWSVPTFTNANLIQSPVFETRWLDWSPTPTGFSSVPTTVANRYRVVKNTVTVISRAITPGTSNATTYTIPLPFTAKTISNMVWQASGTIRDNSVDITTASRVSVSSAASVMDVFTNYLTGTWTSSNTKILYQMTPLTYEI